MRCIFCFISSAAILLCRANISSTGCMLDIWHMVAVQAGSVAQIHRYALLTVLRLCYPKVRLRRLHVLAERGCAGVFWLRRAASSAKMVQAEPPLRPSGSLELAYAATPSHFGPSALRCRNTGEGAVLRPPHLPRGIPTPTPQLLPPFPSRTPFHRHLRRTVISTSGPLSILCARCWWGCGEFGCHTVSKTRTSVYANQRSSAAGLPVLFGCQKQLKRLPGPLHSSHHLC
jgi:hypothetical protein